MKIGIYILLFLMLSIQAIANTETDKQLAKEKSIEAVKLIDARKFDSGIKLLQDAVKLDPTNSKIVYQMAIAYYQKLDIEKSQLIFEKLLKMHTLLPEYYQAYSILLEDVNQIQKALNVLDIGIKKFSEAGILYLQKGTIYAAQKKYNSAINCFEKGIDAEPLLAANYYYAAKLYCYSNEEVWGMIYGEIFMNLERNSKRTTEISKLLFDTYKSEIKFTTDSTTAVSFSKFVSIKNDELSNVAIYEPTLMQALIGTKALNINTLDKVRTKFLDIYYENKYPLKFNNILFQFQKEIKDAGHFEAYNHWLLYKGNETDFTIWQLKNKEKWEKFIEWYKSHKLEINNNNKFVRFKY
ncbi:MAG: hypothetical protein RIQ33_2583 [Bacteroidota bacterium]